MWMLHPSPAAPTGAIQCCNTDRSGNSTPEQQLARLHGAPGDSSCSFWSPCAADDASAGARLNVSLNLSSSEASYTQPLQLA
jgi:hypothetical protein